MTELGFKATAHHQLPSLRGRVALPNTSPRRLSTLQFSANAFPLVLLPMTACSRKFLEYGGNALAGVAILPRSHPNEIDRRLPIRPMRGQTNRRQIESNLEGSPQHSCRDMLARRGLVRSGGTTLLPPRLAFAFMIK